MNTSLLQDTVGCLCEAWNRCNLFATLRESCLWKQLTQLKAEYKDGKNPVPWRHRSIAKSHQTQPCQTVKSHQTSGPSSGMSKCSPVVFQLVWVRLSVTYELKRPKWNLFKEVNAPLFPHLRTWCVSFFLHHSVGVGCWSGMCPFVPTHTPSLLKKKKSI